MPERKAAGKPMNVRSRIEVMGNLCVVNCSKS